MQRAAEGIEYQPEVLQRHGAKERRVVAWLTEHDRCMPLALPEHHVALRDLTPHDRAVGEPEFLLAHREKADLIPHRMGDQAVDGPAVDKEIKECVLTGRSSYGTAHVCDSQITALIGIV